MHMYIYIHVLILCMMYYMIPSYLESIFDIAPVMVFLQSASPTRFNNPMHPSQSADLGDKNHVSLRYIDCESGGKGSKCSESEWYYFCHIFKVFRTCTRQLGWMSSAFSRWRKVCTQRLLSDIFYRSCAPKAVAGWGWLEDVLFCPFSWEGVTIPTDELNQH